jgi:hypothetical protein
VVLIDLKNLVYGSESRGNLRREEGRLRRVREILGSLFHSLCAKGNEGDEKVSLGERLTAPKVEGLELPIPSQRNI